MDNNNYESSEEIKDACWKNAECGQIDFGEIKFRKSNKKNYFKGFLRVFSFILIAALSGGITAKCVISKDNLSENMGGTSNLSSLGNNYNVQGVYNNPISMVAQKVSPAVVGISNKVDGTWNDSEDSGSGIIFKSEGFIVTNYHVIEGAKEIKVKLSSDKVLKASVVGKDPRSDLAIIKVEANNLPTAKFADSSKVKVGDLAIAIGNPLGERFSGTVTAGIISALNRKINVIDKKTGEQTIYKVIQTDAAINPGNSGGALCNAHGEVIGINSLKVDPSNGTEGMGFAITINEAKEIIDDLMTYGKVLRPAIGIYGGTAIPEANNGVQGVYVQEVIRGSGAAVAGIKPTDIIIELGENEVKSMEDLSDTLEKYKIGDLISCKVWRNGKIKNINITLSELQSNR